MDAGFEGLVEGAYAIGCEEENTGVVLQDAEEH